MGSSCLESSMGKCVLRKKLLSAFRSITSLGLHSHHDRMSVSSCIVTTCIQYSYNHTKGSIYSFGWFITPFKENKGFCCTSIFN